MPGVKGRTNNPHGRPPKSKALTDLLGTALARTLVVDGRSISGKRLLAMMVAQALTTGRVKFPNDLEDSVISIKDWMEFVKWAYDRIDGKPAQLVLKGDAEDAGAGGADEKYELPIGVIAPSFIDAYDDIHDHLHTEYVFHGGRGSTKSSFVSLVIIWLIKNFPLMHVLAPAR